jgi:hypothetical protein
MTGSCGCCCPAKNVPVVPAPATARAPAVPGVAAAGGAVGKAKAARSCSMPGGAHVPPLLLLACSLLCWLLTSSRRCVSSLSQ